MGDSSKKKDEGSPRKQKGDPRKQKGGPRERALEERLLAVLESRLRDASARDADLLAALRASAAAQLSPAELDLRLDALRAELERALEERITRRWASEGARLETLTRRLEERLAPSQVAAPPAATPRREAPPEQGALMGALEERLRSAREQDLRHREALFGRALRWVGLPLAFALIVLGAVGLKALADLRAVASAVSLRTAPRPIQEQASHPPRGADPELTSASHDAAPAPLEDDLARLARRAPAHPELARALDSGTLDACVTLDELAPHAALIEPLTDAPAGEPEADAGARRAHLARLLARALREPFRLVAVEGDAGAPELGIARRGASSEVLALGDVLAREAFQLAVDELLSEAATQPTLAALHARVDRLGAPHGGGDPRLGERAFAVRALLGEGAAAIAVDGPAIDTGEVELTILPGDTGAPLAIRRARTAEAWRPLRFLERPERLEFRLVVLQAP